MKKTLFLVLAGASFALCNCHGTVASSAKTTSPNVVPPIKSEVASAPSSVAGKTITLNYANAKTAEKVGGDPWGNWTSSSKSSENFSFPNGNVYKTNAKDSFALQSRTYTKTGKTTAKITEQYGEMSSSYILTFTTPTSGTAVHNENAGVAEVKTKDITFTIN